MRIRTSRRRINCVLLIATITALMASAAAANAWHNPNALRIATAVFITLAAAVEFGMYLYCRRINHQAGERNNRRNE